MPKGLLAVLAFALALSSPLVASRPAPAQSISNCEKASSYLDLADIALSDAKAYEGEGKDDLAQTSREAAYHFAHQANQYLLGHTCGWRIQERANHYYELENPPEPTPEPLNVCNHDAYSANTVPPDYPISVRNLGLGPVTVLVRVTIAPNNNLVSAVITQSSGNADIDAAALSAARKSSYGAKTYRCKRYQSTANLRLQFDPNQ